jgi:hypothetical protein
MSQTPHEGGAQNRHGDGRGTTKNIGEEEGNPKSSPKRGVAEAESHHHQGCGVVPRGHS